MAIIRTYIIQPYRIKMLPSVYFITTLYLCLALVVLGCTTPDIQPAVTSSVRTTIEVAPSPTPTPLSIPTVVSNLSWSNYSRAPAPEWHIGNLPLGGEHVHEGMQTSDGGYIAIGDTQSWLGQDIDED